jgi:outer membrane protein assembly factor BamB
MTHHPNRRTAATRLLIGCISILIVIVAGPALAAADPQVTVPDPEPGSFFTVFDYTHDGRVVAFDGFTVYVQQSRQSATLTAIGTLPEQYRGGTDPAFIAISPNGQTILLGGGAGGSKFPDPDFNGNIFKMPSSGGEATLVGRYMWEIIGTWLDNNTFVFGEGETFGTFTGSVEALNVNTGVTTTIVGNIPGDPGGIVFDNQGNLYVGLGSGQDGNRTGEIRRFDDSIVDAALAGQGFVNFDDGELIAKVLNAGSLAFSSNGTLFVGGANFTTGDSGYIAEVDVDTGQIVRKFDPADGNPNDGSFRVYEVAFTRHRCTLGAIDLISFFNADPSVVYEETHVCN